MYNSTIVRLPTFYRLKVLLIEHEKSEIYTGLEEI